MKTPALHLGVPILLAAHLLSGRAASSGPSILVQTDQAGAAPMKTGVFFEDINYGADGGLYPEKVKNRSFEFTESLMGWKEVATGDARGTLSVLGEAPLNADNPHYLRIAFGEGGGAFGVSNEGFFGMGVRAGAEFTFSVQARAPQGTSPVLAAEIWSAGGQRLARTTVAISGAGWARYAGTMRPSATEAKARLLVFLEDRGAVDLDMVSLFPKDTWKRRANGLRPDLVRWLADLKPAFLRFPGGCIVEGRYLRTRYQWKTTIGPVEQRRLIINRWNDEFRHRPAPDYFQSFGLGFFEYFQLCEDIGAESLPILNCGMACQFNSNELVPMDQLDPYIQDALDLIEFATGPASSPWGRQRAAMGHAQPFPLKLLGVGNEQWGPQYVERYAAFAKVLKARHPEIQLVSSAGPRPEDELFHYLWPRLRELQADIVDEHCYANPEWFFNNSSRYDRYDPSGPKVFMGEYAAQSDKVVSVLNRNNWECALAEAAYLTGLERNSAVVTMSAYAPLFGHEEGWQWRPNLIWLDNLRSYGTPSYYVQQLFSRHRGDRVLPVSVTGAPSSPAGQPRLCASASRDDQAREIVLKVVNATSEVLSVNVQLRGWEALRGRGTETILAAADLKDENSLSEPTKVAPVTRRVQVKGPGFEHAFQPWSLTLLRLRTAGR